MLDAAEVCDFLFYADQMVQRHLLDPAARILPLWAAAADSRALMNPKLQHSQALRYEAIGIAVLVITGLAVVGWMEQGLVAFKGNPHAVSYCNCHRRLLRISPISN